MFISDMSVMLRYCDVFVGSGVSLVVIDVGVSSNIVCVLVCVGGVDCVGCAYPWIDGVRGDNCDSVVSFIGAGTHHSYDTADCVSGLIGVAYPVSGSGSARCV